MGSLEGGPLNLGDGFSGRLDQFNVGGSSSFEIHVFDAKGSEVGIFGPEGWINKHGKGGPGEIPFDLENTLKGIAVDRLQGMEVIPPKGTADISGNKWKDFLGATRKFCKLAGPVGVPISVGILYGRGDPINPGELLCDAVWGCSGAE